MHKFFFLMLFPFLANGPLQNTSINDAILGKWMAEDNNVEVQIYRTNTEYHARIVWFDDTDNKSLPMNTRTDRNNPDRSLRARKILGLEVMHGLHYALKDAEWQDGHIYDARSGKTYNAKLWLAGANVLKVRGYWHFQFLGQTIRFKKV